MFEDSGLPSDRERDDEWRRTLYAELRGQRTVLDRIEWYVLSIAIMLAIAFARVLWNGF